MLAGFSEVNCAVCSISIVRRNSWILENERFGRKNYCSADCLSKGRRKRVFSNCYNPACGKVLYLEPSDLLPHNYCSRSCAATITNTFRKKEKPPNIPKPRLPSKYTKENIIEIIQMFAKKHDRIPVKRELNAEFCAAKRIFGTWNNAVSAAGFRVNRQLFSRRYRAKDGHICDSFAEKIIDDWLTDRQIQHRIHVPYFYRNMSADFSIGNTIVEYFGLYGNMSKYDEHVQAKKEIWKRRNLEVIQIYPNDLFPENKLDIVLQPILSEESTLS